MEDKILHIEGLGVETAFVYDFTSHGELFLADAVNCCEDAFHKSDFSMLLMNDSDDLKSLRKMMNGAVICFDCNQSVIASYHVINGMWSNVETKQSGQPDFSSVFAVFAVSEGVPSINPCAGELAWHALKSFQKGDVVRFKERVNYLQLPELAKLIRERRDDSTLCLKMDSREYATVETKEFLLSGTVLHAKADKTYSMCVTCSNGRTESERKQRFDVTGDKIDVSVTLNPGANYIECILIEDENEIISTKNNHIVFFKQQANQEKDVIMWAEQYVNANVTNSVEKLEELTDTAKNAGITAFALDLKGVEGYCSYQMSTRTHVPYMTCSSNPKKQITMEIDFLEEFIKAAHKKGLKVYGSFNFFVEGNLSSNDFAIDLPNTHPDWAEVLYVPEDGGQLKSVLETKRSCMLCYVNPANDEVWEFESQRVREVLENYEIDGIIMDRTRYDNQYADFSDVTKLKFIDYLTKRGKRLVNWPQDIYSFDAEQSMVFGPLYLEWLTFRSSIIQGFAAHLRTLVKEYQGKLNRKIALAAYVGSWYDLYYQNGVNWASSEFVYHDMLNFPVSKLYSRDYARTSYLDSIDFIMIGCYYETAELIEKYTTIGNVVTNHQIPVIASLSLPHLKTEESLCIGTKACIDYSEGAMIFDLCYTDWNQLTKALKEALHKVKR